MGSLFKTPTMPTYTPSTTVSSSPTSTDVDTDIDVDTSADEGAVQDVIRRAARGRGSTIQTSFRGVLSKNNALVPQRKNLLGE